VCEKAKAGIISREQFPMAVLRLEFQTTKDTRDLVRGFNFSTKERRKSHYYSSFMECPNDFESFITYMKKMPGGRDRIKDYEAQYDALRRAVSGD